MASILTAFVLTRTQSSLVNPSVHLCPLSLQGINVRLQIRNFALQVLNLVTVRSYRLVESLQQKVWRWLMLRRRCRLAAEPSTSSTST